MLVSKFSVPITRKILPSRLKNVFVRSASKVSCSGDKKRICGPRKKAGDQIIRNQCEEHKATIAKCPKTSFEKLSYNKQLSEPLPKCSAKVSDIYLQSLESVKEYTCRVLVLICNSTKSIQDELETEIQQQKAKESTRRQIILKTVENKLLELIELDSSCGLKKKTEFMMINDKVSRELQFWHRDDLSIFKAINMELRKLQCETKSKCNYAVALILSCRRCSTPQSLLNCVETNVQEARRILDQTNENNVKRLRDVNNSKEETLKDYKEILEGITDSYREEILEFSEHLTSCVESIKNQ